MAQKIPNPKLMDMICDVLQVYDEPMTFYEIKRVLQSRHGHETIHNMVEDVLIALRVDLVKAGRVTWSTNGNIVLYQAAKGVN